MLLLGEIFLLINRKLSRAKRLYVWGANSVGINDKMMGARDDL
jgi:hypothetical protein